MSANVNEPQHPLFGASLRVDRAAKHIQELRAGLQAWTDMHPELVEGIVVDDGEPKFRPKMPLTIEPLALASVTIGDALYNLRAALDYLVYAIAIYNNKIRHVPGTQFPIEDDAAMFDARVTGVHPRDKKKRVAQYLRCVPPSAVAQIRKLQPFEGTLWTGSLRELSNPDKHRTVTALSSRSSFRGEIVRSPDGTPTAVQGNFEVQVFFGGTETDAVDTLELLEREVRATIELFKTGFKAHESLGA